MYDPASSRESSAASTPGRTSLSVAASFGSSRRSLNDSSQNPTRGLKDEGYSGSVVRRRASVIPRSQFSATLCWMGERPLALGYRYTLRLATRKVKAIVSDVVQRVDVRSLSPAPGLDVQMNDIAHVNIQTLQPVLSERYRDNRILGGFILVDEANKTAAAGMIL
jgi:sulfate adenylyltransferase subunit 1 (EFTu-like GTPase family)